MNQKSSFNQTFDPLTRIAASALILALTATALPFSAFAQTADTSAVRIPQTFQFGKNLKVGQTISPDIMYLQRFLNLSPTTQIAETGAGSNSQLTNYFGLKTKDAVMRFQNIYKSEVLTPAGLTMPTGNVGEYTRKKINALLALVPDGGQPYASLQSGAQTGQNQQAASQQAMQNGYQSQTQYTALQYQQQTQPSLADYQSTAVDPSSLISQVPPEYQQQLMNELNSQVNLATYDTRNDPTTGAENYVKPQILAVTPTVISSPEQWITIYGQDFEPRLTIFSNLGMLPVVSRDGGTRIEVRLQDFDEYETSRLYYSSSTQDIFFQAVNAGFSSDNAAVVKYHFPYYVTASSTNNGVGAESDTKASDSGLMNGVIGLGAAVGVGLLAGAVAKAFATGATSVAAGAAGAAGTAAAGDVAGRLVNRPFGGRLLFLHPCLDSPNLLLYVLDTTRVVPLPKRLVYVPILSRLYQNFIFRPGGFVMGNYIVGGWCTASGTGVVAGTIRQIGTSF